jgi:hypothetical protein
MKRNIRWHKTFNNKTGKLKVSKTADDEKHAEKDGAHDKKYFSGPGRISS